LKSALNFKQNREFSFSKYRLLFFRNFLSRIFAFNGIKPCFCRRKSDKF